MSHTTLQMMFPDSKCLSLSNELRTNALSLTTKKLLQVLLDTVFWTSMNLRKCLYLTTPKIWALLQNFLDPNWSQSTKLGQIGAGSGLATVQFHLELPKNAYQNCDFITIFIMFFMTFWLFYKNCRILCRVCSLLKSIMNNSNLLTDNEKNEAFHWCNLNTVLKQVVGASWKAPSLLLF